MADTPETGGNPQDNNPQNMPSMRMLVQYVKDLSFENPGAPVTLRANQAQPNIDINIDVQARGMEDNAYEVTIIMSAQAKRGDETTFICELSYSGLFELLNFDDAARQPMLLVECPRLLFPYARRVFADATRDGGFPPLMLEPIDFAGLYRQQLARQQAGGQAPEGAAPVQ
ncbi:protein-export chaperone SecB [Hyphobacterium sp. HN65]|uniref:Protein-export protein SecB n=1 Tax=Hyphobacterium lacteum TaxID=3116575 RepID=A0ABU7LRY4_9PROT|nr:protein-export chaperone SecB [Hyphobacterium sp. HN65]MEE2526635.1 protein-export chaperone SecB [Hyphobacterium sp. HN65]